MRSLTSDTLILLSLPEAREQPRRTESCDAELRTNSPSFALLLWCISHNKSLAHGLAPSTRHGELFVTEACGLTSLSSSAFQNSRRRSDTSENNTLSKRQVAAQTPAKLELDLGTHVPVRGGQSALIRTTCCRPCQQNTAVSTVPTANPQSH